MLIGVFCTVELSVVLIGTRPYFEGAVMRLFARVLFRRLYNATPIVFFLLAGTFGTACHAQNADQSGDSGWLARVSASQAEQPHWITPLATVTPRLEQEIRYDNFWEDGLSGGASLTNYDGAKALNLYRRDAWKLSWAYLPTSCTTIRALWTALGILRFS
jgi:hypothetical protein